MTAPPKDSTVDSFHLNVGVSDGGDIHAFGRYWVWGKTVPAELPPLQLFEWTDEGIIAIPSDSSSLHRVKAGTPHFIDGLFGYWLIADGDQQWLQTLHRGGRSFGLISGGGFDLLKWQLLCALWVIVFCAIGTCCSRSNSLCC